MEDRVIERYDALAPVWEGDRPPANLLRSPYARGYIALMQALFPNKTEAVEAEFLHAAVEACVRGMAEDGLSSALPYQDMEDLRGKSICERILSDFRWFEARHVPSAPGRYEYVLTADAIRMLSAIDDLSSVDIAASSAQVEILYKEMSRVCASLSESQEERIRYWEGLRDDAQRHIDEELAGVAKVVTEKEAMGEVSALCSLMRGLAPNFVRVAERIEEISRGFIMKVYEGDGLDGGEALSVVEAMRGEVRETTEGQAFLDTLDVGSSPSKRRRFDVLAESLASAPVFSDRGAVRRAIADGWAEIFGGVDRVIDSYSDGERSLSNVVFNVDPKKHRAVSAALREVRGPLSRWARAARASAVSPLELPGSRPDGNSLRLPCATLEPERRPAPPRRVAEGSPLDPSVLRKIGDPQVQRVIEALLSRAVLDADGLVSVSRTFEMLDDEDRRLVEVIGIVGSATRGLSGKVGGETVWSCVGMDGQTRRWTGPEMSIGMQELSTLLRPR